MATELSSNWKKLQAKIKAESPSQKRKASDSVSGLDDKARGPPAKKPKQHQNPVPQPAKAALKPSTTPSLRPKSQQSKPPMGNTQSSKIDRVVPKQGVSASLALWAADNDITAEALAEAYGLGLQANSLLASDGPARPNEGLAADGVPAGKYVAIDCEMVGIGEGGHDDAVARVSIVDFHGRQVYDSYVRPRARVVDWRTHVSGVSPRHMAEARTFDEVHGQVADLLKGRIVVGHDVKHDLRVLELDHSAKMIRDTSKFSGFRKYGHGPKPALRVLAREILGVEIHNGQHSSIEDARVAMLLFRKHKSAFDVEHAHRYPDASNVKPKKAKGKKAKGKKAKRR